MLDAPGGGHNKPSCDRRGRKYQGGNTSQWLIEINGDKASDDDGQSDHHASVLTASSSLDICVDLPCLLVHPVIGLNLPPSHHSLGSSRLNSLVCLQCLWRREWASMKVEFGLEDLDSPLKRWLSPHLGGRLGGIDH